MKTLRKSITPSFYLNMLNIYSTLSIILGIEFIVSEENRKEIIAIMISIIKKKY